MFFKRGMICLAGALLAASAACGERQPAANAPAPTPAPANQNKPGADTARIAPKVLKEMDGPDNSHVLVKQLENGDQIEARTWKSGPVAKIARRLTKDGKKMLRVTLRDGQRYRVEDQSVVEHALDWTGEQLAEAAKKSGKPIAGADADE